jgi:tetratricopeptide (TPR) repeat protein
MLNYNHDDHVPPISKFEAMLRTNEVLFFDAQEFESIVHHYIEFGKLNLADRALEIGMNQHPENGHLLLLKSEILIFEGDFKTSLEIIEMVEKLIPHNEEIFLQKATIASKSKQHLEAIKFLDKALEISEDPLEIWGLLGMEFLILEDFNSAKYYFQLCLEEDPLDYQSLYNLLHTYEQLDDSSGAIQTLNTILEKDPYCEVAWHQLGKIYSNLQKYNEAISAFEFAIISDDKFTGAYIEIGKILEKTGKLNMAIENYHIALKINDPSAFVFFRIANCYNILGCDNLSIQFHKKAINTDPTFEKSWISIIDYYQKVDLNKALIYAQRAIDSNGDNSIITHKLGNVLFKLKRYSDASFYYDSVIKLGETNIEIWSDLLDCLIVLYRFNQGKDIVSSALHVYPNCPEIIFRLAIIELKLGNIESSKEILFSLKKSVLNKLFKNDLYSDLKNIF